MSNKMNWLADRLLQQQQAGKVDLGAWRAARQAFANRNNYERAVNDITGRLTTHPSQRIAVARHAGFNTQGLIIGGRRDDGDDSGGIPRGGPVLGNKRPGGGNLPPPQNRPLPGGGKGGRAGTGGQTGPTTDPRKRRPGGI